MLLHVVPENARDAFSRLTRLVDVDRIVSRHGSVDWGYLEDAARRGGLGHALALVLAMSRAVFGTEVPEDVHRRLRPPAAVRFHLEMLRPASSLMEQRSLRRASWAELMSLWLLSGQSRAKALVRMLRADSGAPLQWLWDGGTTDNHHVPAFTRRVSRVGKVVAYQLGTYVLHASGVRGFSVVRNDHRREWQLW